MLEQRVGLETAGPVDDIPAAPVEEACHGQNVGPKDKQRPSGDANDVRVLLWLAGKMGVVTPESGVGADDALDEALAGLSPAERTTFDGLGMGEAA
jgi:hypothetical protein